MLTQHLATHVGPFGIRVNCLAPETILTERNEAQIPEEATEESSWVTGVILDVAGDAVMT
jgi:3-oxoacyl-[acyl-carrier protein] reductase